MAIVTNNLQPIKGKKKKAQTFSFSSAESLALRKLRQEDYKFSSGLGFIVKPSVQSFCFFVNLKVFLLFKEGN